MEQSTIPRDGCWNLRNKKVAEGVHLHSWGLLCFAQDRDLGPAKIDMFLDSFISVAEELGIQVENKEPPIAYAGSQTDVEKSLKNAWATVAHRCGDQPQLLMCLLPSSNVFLYGMYINIVFISDIGFS
jgi:hypothetical protein